MECGIQFDSMFACVSTDEEECHKRSIHPSEAAAYHGGGGGFLGEDDGHSWLTMVVCLTSPPLHLPPSLPPLHLLERAKFAAVLSLFLHPHS